MKYYGKIGYAVQEEIRPGVYTPDRITERTYMGDVTKVNSRWETSDQANDDLNIRNELSILADGFALQHFSDIRYAEWMGIMWKVKSVTVEYPRLQLSIGGVYNGPTASAS